MRLTTGAFIYSIPSVSKILTSEQKLFWQEWIRALQSGRYRQVRKDLCNVSGYSCIGVAADLLVDGKKLSWTPLQCGTKTLLTQNQVTYITCLPLDISKRIGLLRDCSDSVYLEDQEFHITLFNKEKYTLQNLNEMGVSFEEIAAILEWALEGGYTPGRYYGYKD